MSTKFVKTIELTGLSAKRSKQLQIYPDDEKASLSGIDGDRLLEPEVNFVVLPSEHVISHENNTWIVFGRDRPGDRFSGYSAKGHTNCGSIDIVVGRTSYLPKGVDPEGKKIWVNPNFETDAARIHISQKTDIDKNFGLVEGHVGQSTKKSGIGLKADSIRIVAREGIKLVTGLDKVNSQGGKSVGKYGIDLIAMNDDKDLQPIPKGNNLVEAMSELVELVSELSGIIETFMSNQNVLNAVAAFHTHPTAPPSAEMAATGIATSIKIMSQSYFSLLANKANLSIFKLNYLTPMAEKFINSEFNTTS